MCALEVENLSRLCVFPAPPGRYHRRFWKTEPFLLALRLVALFWFGGSGALPCHCSSHQDASVRPSGAGTWCSCVGSQVKPSSVTLLWISVQAVFHFAHLWERVRREPPPLFCLSSLLAGGFLLFLPVNDRPIPVWNCCLPYLGCPRGEEKSAFQRGALEAVEASWFITFTLRRSLKTDAFLRVCFSRRSACCVPQNPFRCAEQLLCGAVGCLRVLLVAVC